MDEGKIAMFCVVVIDPEDPVGSRYYGPFQNDKVAETWAATMRGNGVHAVVQPLWRA